MVRTNCWLSQNSPSPVIPSFKLPLPFTMILHPVLSLIFSNEFPLGPRMSPWEREGQCKCGEQRWRIVWNTNHEVVLRILVLRNVDLVLEAGVLVGEARGRLVRGVDRLELKYVLTKINRLFNWKVLDEQLIKNLCDGAVPRVDQLALGPLVARVHPHPSVVVDRLGARRSAGTENNNFFPKIQDIQFIYIPSIYLIYFRLFF